MMQLLLHGRTETGPVRGDNEDVILVGRVLRNSGETGLCVEEDDCMLLRDGLLAVVADGMGGHAAGETAARMALETLDETFHQSEKNGDLRMLVNVLRGAGNHANEAVTAAGAGNSQYAGMGCTLAGVALMGREYVVFHAGDSRVYRFRHGALRSLTEDDTVVALAVRNGHMTQEEAENSPARHYVTNAAGAASFELHTAEPQSLRPQDTLMISSDGLHGLIDLETMEQLLASEGTAALRCAALAAEAVRRGGNDNISVILIDAKEQEAPAPHG
jgi:protein phosphatase